MSFLFSLYGIGVLVQHWKEVLVGLVVLILFIRSVRKHKQKKIMALQEQQRKAAAEEQRKKEVAEEKRRKEEEKTTEIAKQAPTVTLAEQIDGKQLAYRYDDVKLVPSNATVLAKLAAKLNLVDENGQIKVYQDNLCIGSLPENRLSGMVRDWQKKGDPIVSYTSAVGDGKVEIMLVFYTDIIERFLAKNPDAKQYRLTGKPDEFAFCSVGNKCEIEQDLELEKYAVLVDGLRVGFLPKAAEAYAEKNEIQPDELDVIVSGVEYDMDKDRDVISVYISA